MALLLAPRTWNMISILSQVAPRKQTLQLPHPPQPNLVLRTLQLQHPPQCKWGCKVNLDRYQWQFVVPISFEPYGLRAPESFKRLEENGASVSTHKWTGSGLLIRIIELCMRSAIWATADVALASLGQGAARVISPAVPSTKGRACPAQPLALGHA